MRILWILVLTFLSPVIGWGQSEVDSLKVELASVKEDSTRIDILGELAYELLKADVEQSGLYAREAMELSTRFGDPRRIAQSLINMGNYRARSGTVDKTEVDSLYLQALEITQSLRDTAMLCVVYNDLGIQACNGGDRPGAIEWYRRALAADPDTSNASLYSMILRNLGIALDLSKQYDLAEKYFLDAITVAENGDDMFEKAEATNSLAITFSKRGELRRGLNTFKEAVQLYAQLDKPETLMNTLNNISFSYQMMEHLDSASLYLDGILEQVMESGNHKLQMRVMSNQASILGKRGLYDQAISTLQEALLLAPKNADPHHEEGLLEELGQLYRKKGDLENALIFSDRYHTLKDSVNNAKTIERIHELEILYETARKDQLLQQQEMLIDQERNRRKLYLAIIIFLLISVITWYFISRERVKVKNKIARQEMLIREQKINALEIENKMISMSSMIRGQEEERSRVAQDLHDGLGGLMATIKSHFTSLQPENTNGRTPLYDKTFALIDRACADVSRISHDLMPKALSEHGLTEAITDLAVNLREAHGLNVEVDFQGLDKRLYETQETVIYRIIQELTTNIVKHANGTSVLIQLIRKNGKVFILVEDDGEGFDYQNSIQSDGLGLKGLESRVNYLNGAIDFDTVKGEGTTVTVNIELAEQTEMQS